MDSLKSKYELTNQEYEKIHQHKLEIHTLNSEYDNYVLSDYSCCELREQYQDIEKDYQYEKKVYDDIEHRYRISQAGILASQLQDNQPCPVCGSLKHPHPASIDFEIVDHDDLKRAKQKFDHFSERRNEIFNELMLKQKETELMKKHLDEDAKRLGIDIIQTEVHDATKLKEEYINKFDKILLDVPCLGLGVIRRKPDIKWNRQEEDIKEISDIQFNILKTCSKYLKKNGTLVYSTCSMLKEENDAIIERFIKEEKFETVNIEEQIPNEFSKITTNNMVQFLPSQKHDGFFITMLKKI